MSPWLAFFLGFVVAFVGLAVFTARRARAAGRGAGRDGTPAPPREVDEILGDASLELDEADLHKLDALEAELAQAQVRQGRPQASRR